MRAPRLRLAPLVLLIGACTYQGEGPVGASTFKIVVTRVNGADPPAPESPLPANRGDVEEVWEFTVEARSATGELEPFDGEVRLSVEPGAVMGVSGDGAVGRNIRLQGGKATGSVRVTAVYGAARLWAEDVGYVPAAPGAIPACANGINDDEGDDVLIDFPNDPGCAYADDDTEEAGTFAAGVSRPVAYALPRLSDIQGGGATTPYPFEGIEVNTSAPQQVIVTRVASDGFYITDLADQTKGYNSLFAFNFSTPAGMRVCDRLVYLAGTVNEFFGFTELSFPSYRVEPVFEGQPCPVPEPTLLDATIISDPVAMEKLESSLVRIEGYAIAKNFGSGTVVNNKFEPDASSCDLNGDGRVDFESEAEASCGNACSDDPAGECSEWTGFVARGNYLVHKGASKIQINTGTAAGFDPQAHKGEVLVSVTGTLRNFSGGSLNWTIETRCEDDLVCAGDGCVPAALPSDKACVRLRTVDDNDQGTN